MKGKLTETEFECACSLIINLIQDESKQEVDFSATSLSPSNIMFVLEELGIHQIEKTTTSNCEDFFTKYEGGLVLYYNAWMFICILMKGSDYNGSFQDTQEEGN